MQSVNRRALLCASAWIALVSVTPVFPQASTGSVQGRITDPSGAALPTVVVAMRHVETNSERKTVTNVEGIYDTGPLQPGEYEVSADAPGFKKASAKVTVLTGANHTVDFAMALGATSESVTVEGEASLVNLVD